MRFFLVCVVLLGVLLSPFNSKANAFSPGNELYLLTGDSSQTPNMAIQPTRFEKVSIIYDQNSQPLRFITEHLYGTLDETQTVEFLMFVNSLGLLTTQIQVEVGIFDVDGTHKSTTTFGPQTLSGNAEWQTFSSTSMARSSTGKLPNKLENATVVLTIRSVFGGPAQVTTDATKVENEHSRLILPYRDMEIKTPPLSTEFFVTSLDKEVNKAGEFTTLTYGPIKAPAEQTLVTVTIPPQTSILNSSRFDCSSERNNCVWGPYGSFEIEKLDIKIHKDGMHVVIVHFQNEKGFFLERRIPLGKTPIQKYFFPTTAR